MALLFLSDSLLHIYSILYSVLFCFFFFLDLDEMSDKGSSEHEEGDQEGSTKASSPGSSSSVPLPSVLLDRKLDTLILEWNKSPDMLFTIHPNDGSFLVWHIKYLDEFIPGIFRQVQVRYSFRNHGNDES